MDQQSEICQICRTILIQITLRCQHQFCKECIHNLVIQKMTIQDFKALNCPQEGCEEVLSQEDIENILNEKEFINYCVLKPKLINIESFSKDELLITCLDPYCEYKWVIWNKADYTTCTKCSEKFCSNCRQQYHEGLNCYETKNQLNSSLKMNRGVHAQKLGIVFCPHCKIATQKTDGCNIIQCKSQKCKGFKYFCYQCGVKLSNHNELDHYLDRNPYRDQCLVKKRSGEWEQDHSSKSLIQIHQDNDQVDFPQNNGKACPSCKTFDPNICEIILNFNGQVCFCECKGKHLCLSCGQELSETGIDGHFDKKFKCMQKCRIY